MFAKGDRLIAQTQDKEDWYLFFLPHLPPLPTCLVLKFGETKKISVSYLSSGWPPEHKRKFCGTQWPPESYMHNAFDILTIHRRE